MAKQAEVKVSISVDWQNWGYQHLQFYQVSLPRSWLGSLLPFCPPSFLRLLLSTWWFAVVKCALINLFKAFSLVDITGRVIFAEDTAIKTMNLCICRLACACVSCQIFFLNAQYWNLFVLTADCLKKWTEQTLVNDRLHSCKADIFLGHYEQSCFYNMVEITQFWANMYVSCEFSFQLEKLFNVCEVLPQKKRT